MAGIPHMLTFCLFSPSPFRLKRSGGVIPSPFALNRTEETPPSSVRVKNTQEGSFPPPFPSKRGGQGFPSPFTAMSHQKTKEKGKNNAGAPLRPLSSSFRDHVIIFMTIRLCITIRGQGKGGGSEGERWRRVVRTGSDVTITSLVRLWLLHFWMKNRT